MNLPKQFKIKNNILYIKNIHPILYILLLIFSILFLCIVLYIFFLSVFELPKTPSLEKLLLVLLAFLAIFVVLKKLKTFLNPIEVKINFSTWLVSLKHINLMWKDIYHIKNPNLDFVIINHEMYIKSYGYVDVSSIKLKVDNKYYTIQEIIGKDSLKQAHEIKEFIVKKLVKTHDITNHWK